MYYNRSGSGWLLNTPELMRAVLLWIKDQYNNPDVYITENGFSDRNGRIGDEDRIDYYKYYINYVMQGKMTGKYVSENAMRLASVEMCTQLFISET